MNTQTKALVDLHYLEFRGRRSERGRARALEGKIARLRRRAGHALLHKYEIRKPNYGASCIVPIRGRFCSGCWVALSLQMRRRAYNQLTECEHCARLLYNPSRPKRLRMEVA